MLQIFSRLLSVSPSCHKNGKNIVGKKIHNYISIATFSLQERCAQAALEVTLRINRTPSFFVFFLHKVMPFIPKAHLTSLYLLPDCDQSCIIRNEEKLYMNIETIEEQSDYSLVCPLF